MAKVHPNAALTHTISSSKSLPSSTTTSGSDTVLTVWKKSLLFNCSGYTVFDAKGNLVFRVDNYMRGNKGEIVLMDAAGKPLLTIRRKKLSFGDNWLVYDGETNVNPIYSVRKHVTIMNHKSLAHVTATGGSSSSSSRNNNNNEIYEIQGSYAQRCCSVYDAKKRKVAEIKRKEAVGGVAFGVDIFRLIVQPEINTPLAMAIVILLDLMFGGSSRRLYASLH